MNRALGLACSFALVGGSCTSLHDLNDVTGGTNTGGASAADGGGAGDSGIGGTTPSDGGGGSGGDDSTAGGSGGQTPEEFCTETHVFCDDFEDADTADWTVSGGMWGVVQSGGNHSYQGIGSEESIIGDPEWGNQTIEAEVRVVAFNGATDDHRVGIVGRYASSSSFYVFALGGDGNATLRKATSDVAGLGTCGAVAVTVDESEWFTMRMEISGTGSSVIINTFIDDELVHGCTNTSNTVSAGAVGLSTVGSGTNGDFDDVRVTIP